MRHLVLLSLCLAACRSDEGSPKTRSASETAVDEVELKLLIADPTTTWRRLGKPDAPTQEVRFYDTAGTTTPGSVIARARSGKPDVSIKIAAPSDRVGVSKCEVDARLQRPPGHALELVDDGTLKCTYTGMATPAAISAATTPKAIRALFGSLQAHLPAEPVIVGFALAQESKVKLDGATFCKKADLEYWVPAKAVAPSPPALLELSCKVAPTNRAAAIVELQGYLDANQLTTYEPPSGKTELAYRWGFAP